MRLLLVEDEEKVVHFVTLGLKAEKFSVDDTRDGRSGLAMALETPYDLLIVDLLLPELVRATTGYLLEGNENGFWRILLETRNRDLSRQSSALAPDRDSVHQGRPRAQAR